MQNIWKYIVYSLRIRRVEYRLAELPIFFIPVLLTVTDRSQLTSLVMWEGLIAFLFLFAFGDLLNCLADRDLDAIYKPHLTEAVDGIGARGVILQSVLSAIAAIGLTVHIAWMTGRWMLVPMVVVGLVVAWAYSVEPVRLKRRGIWQLWFYWVGLFLAPMMFAACLFVDVPPASVLLVCAAFACVQTGVILVNTAEDFPEDRQLNVRTAIIAMGLQRGISVASWLTAVGTVLLLGILYWNVLQSTTKMNLVGLIPLSAALFYCTHCVAKLAESMRGTTEEVSIDLVKKAAKRVPVWMTSVALGTLVAATAVSQVL